MSVWKAIGLDLVVTWWYASFTTIAWLTLTLMHHSPMIPGM